MKSELIDRINELYHKSKTVGLTDDEKAEQDKLRKQYVAGFRQGMQNTLENVYIVDEKGNEKKIEKVFEKMVDKIERMLYIEFEQKFARTKERVPKEIESRL